jgi:hypothetical protein
MSSFFVVIEKRRRRGGGGGGGVHKLDERDARDSPKLLNVAAWQKLGSKILLRFPLVLGRREAGFDCPDIWHSPIPEWQLPESLLAENLLHKQLVDTGVKTMPK